MLQSPTVHRYAVSMLEGCKEWQSALLARGACWCADCVLTILQGRFIHVPPSEPCTTWNTNFGVPWWRNPKYVVCLSAWPSPSAWHSQYPCSVWSAFALFPMSVLKQDVDYQTGRSCETVDPVHACWMVTELVHSIAPTSIPGEAIGLFSHIAGAEHHPSEPCVNLCTSKESACTRRLCAGSAAVMDQSDATYGFRLCTWFPDLFLVYPTFTPWSSSRIMSGTVVELEALKHRGKIRAGGGRTDGISCASCMVSAACRLPASRNRAA